VRHGLSSNLSFSEEDRKENMSRIGEPAELMTKARVIALTAFISPFWADREIVRSLLLRGEFIEIYCKSQLALCESRDDGGLCKKARAGEIKNYTGIDFPYESPINPEIEIETEMKNIDECVNQVIKFLFEEKSTNELTGSGSSKSIGY